MTCLLGIDVGSSSIKACLIDAESASRVARAQSPGGEMPIDAPRAGWAEQAPELWWEHVRRAVREAVATAEVAPEAIAAVGISYQMHGLVLVDERHDVLRPAIIWCDSRAVEVGERAAAEIGREVCLQRLLNTPGNFTASKLAWVKENEPELYGRIHRMMLPGDYVAMRMTGEIVTTVSGLSEGTLWDFAAASRADFLLEHLSIDPGLVPRTVSTFSDQGRLTADAAADLGLAAGTVVGYRAGDQPNNAFSLNVLEPGQVAATAGTSGVVYGVTDRTSSDPMSRVNTFAHVNHEPDDPRLGVLLCVNGTGALNAWLRRHVAVPDRGYEDMNEQAAGVPVGSDGLTVLPFGNGAERMLGNRNLGCQLVGLDFQRHSAAHLFRASQEGIACALAHGMGVLAELGLDLSRIRAGTANMFLSPVFREALAGLTDTRIELYDTDGAEGAARAAGVGVGIYESAASAFEAAPPRLVVEPDGASLAAYAGLLERWQAELVKAGGD